MPNPTRLSARKAVVTAAGLGTRFLPATKAIPKELLPVVDTPAVQYIVEEAVRAGLNDVLVVTSRGKGAIADHFDRAPELEAVLDAKGDKERLATVVGLAELANLHFVRQGSPRGLGHAVLRAAPYVGHESFALLLGDDLIDERDELLSTMLAIQAERGGCVVALLQVPRHSISLYGCAVVEPVSTNSSDEIVRIVDLIEKPSIEDSPSDLAIIGRYVLSSRVFDVLAHTVPAKNDEIQLTDGLRTLVELGEPVHGVIFRGRRYDTGDRVDYLRTIVRLACEREDIGPGFRQWLEDFVAGRV